MTESAPHSQNVLIRQRAFVPIPLSQLRAGDWATVSTADLRCDECELLSAMGLTEQCKLRVCKIGEPCIVQVNSTRLGLARDLARRILVRPISVAS
jgi:Fe2+ transport system protein FeoA